MIIAYRDQNNMSFQHNRLTFFLMEKISFLYNNYIFLNKYNRSLVEKQLLFVTTVRFMYIFLDVNIGWNVAK